MLNCWTKPSKLLAKWFTWRLYFTSFHFWQTVENVLIVRHYFPSSVFSPPCADSDNQTDGGNQKNAADWQENVKSVCACCAVVCCIHARILSLVRRCAIYEKKDQTTKESTLGKWAHYGFEVNFCLAVCRPPWWNSLRQDPPWFEFLVIFDFFAPWYRRGREASSVKIL